MKRLLSGICMLLLIALLAGCGPVPEAPESSSAEVSSASSGEPSEIVDTAPPMILLQPQNYTYPAGCDEAWWEIDYAGENVTARWELQVGDTVYAAATMDGAVPNTLPKELGSDFSQSGDGRRCQIALPQAALNGSKLRCKLENARGKAQTLDATVALSKEGSDAIPYFYRVPAEITLLPELEEEVCCLLLYHDNGWYNNRPYRRWYYSEDLSLPFEEWKKVSDTTTESCTLTGGKLPDGWLICRVQANDKRNISWSSPIRVTTDTSPLLSIEAQGCARPWALAESTHLNYFVKDGKAYYPDRLREYDLQLRIVTEQGEYLRTVNDGDAGLTFTPDIFTLPEGENSAAAEVTVGYGGKTATFPITVYNENTPSPPRITIPRNYDFWLCGKPRNFGYFFMAANGSLTLQTVKMEVMAGENKYHDNWYSNPLPVTATFYETDRDGNILSALSTVQGENPTLKLEKASYGDFYIRAGISYEGTDEILLPGIVGIHRYGDSPVIVDEPVDRRVDQGESRSFFFVTAENVLSYQWYMRLPGESTAKPLRDGNGVSGAASDRLYLPSDPAYNGAVVSCELIGNDLHFCRTREATFTVTPHERPLKPGYEG